MILSKARPTSSLSFAISAGSRAPAAFHSWRKRGQMPFSRIRWPFEKEDLPHLASHFITRAVLVVLVSLSQRYIEFADLPSVRFVGSAGFVHERERIYFQVNGLGVCRLIVCGYGVAGCDQPETKEFERKGAGNCDGEWFWRNDLPFRLEFLSALLAFSNL